MGGSPRVGEDDQEQSVPGGVGVEGGQQLPHGGGQGAHVQEDGGVPKKWFGPIKSGFAQEFRKVNRYSRKVADGLVQRGIEKFVKLNQNLGVGGISATATGGHIISNKMAGKRKMTEPADRPVDLEKKLKVKFFNSDI